MIEAGLKHVMADKMKIHVLTQEKPSDLGEYNPIELLKGFPFTIYNPEQVEVRGLEGAQLRGLIPLLGAGRPATFYVSVREYERAMHSPNHVKEKR